MGNHYDVKTETRFSERESKMESTPYTTPRGSVGGTPALAGTGANVFGDVGTVADGSALKVGSPVKKSP